MNASSRYGSGLYKGWGGALYCYLRNTLLGADWELVGIRGFMSERVLGGGGTWPPAEMFRNSRWESVRSIFTCQDWPLGGVLRARQQRIEHEQLSACTTGGAVIRFVPFPARLDGSGADNPAAPSPPFRRGNFASPPRRRFPRHAWAGWQP